jgi:hypothetical protein
VTVSPDEKLIDAFDAGTLDEEGQATLAYQVARLLPVHWMLPNPAVAALTKIIDHLGGDSALLAWLDRYPGLPRLVASTYELIALLDALSDRPSVVTALEETRQQVGLPPEVAGYLMPDITTETRANLSGQIESILADENYEAAVGLARAAVEVLQHVASRTPPHDPDLVDLSRQLDRIREKLDRVSGTR